VSPEAVAALLSTLEERQVPAGEVLFHQDDPGDACYIVADGQLYVHAQQPDGSEASLKQLGPGECAGEMALLTGQPRSATIYTTRLSDVLVLSRNDFEELLCGQPQLLLNLTRRIIRREVRLTQPAGSTASTLVIAVLPVRSGGVPGALTRQLAEALGTPRSVLLLDPDRFDALYGKPGAAQTPLDHAGSLAIGTWLDARESAHRYVIYEAPRPLDGAGVLAPWARRCVENADVILLVGEGKADPAPAAGEVAPGAGKAAPGTGKAPPYAVEAALAATRSRARLELVLLHPADSPTPSGTAAWLAARGGEGPQGFRAHHHVRLGNAADFRRLGRRISGRTIGLALAGGGARGWAHVGALRALEEANLEVDCVGGASMGAIIAAGCALDWSSAQLTQLAHRFSNPKLLLDYTLPYAAVTATRRISALLQSVYGETGLEDTWRPCFSVSVNLTRGEEQLHTTGTLWRAVRASMAFPGIFAPVYEDGCVLIDGGAANNLPIDRMRELCPTGTVIGIDLITGSPTPGPYDFGPSLSGWQALLGHWGLPSRHVRAPNLLDIVAGVIYCNMRYRVNEVRGSADLLINVPVEDYGLLSFDRCAEIIERGYRAAKEQLAGFECPARL
jgi:predicted acylesterase/phospholipase RssA/CRP-like cAMP-binding protein